MSEPNEHGDDPVDAIVERKNDHRHLPDPEAAGRDARVGVPGGAQPESQLPDPSARVYSLEEMVKLGLVKVLPRTRDRVQEDDDSIHGYNRSRRE